MPEAKLSSKNQIVVPRAAREALGIKPGDTVLVVIRGRTAIFLRKPDDHARAIRGIAKALYPDGYLAEERKSWR
ncbi:MAG: AbrB/MazE/SpoVT family DNA-binding domain-containing protein [Acidobacteriota bacterium]